MSQITGKEQDIINRLERYIYENGMSNDALVQLIELTGTYLNITPLAKYAKKNGISYNGAKYHRKKITLFQTKFIIDNF